MVRLAPSILSADFSQLGEEVKRIETAGAQILHVDVMDGHFVPNISYGAVVMKSLLGRTKLPFDVHLMIEHPDRYLEDFVTDQTEFISVHAEACSHLHRTVQHVKSLGVKAGVALNPGTSLHCLDYMLDEIDMVLIMSVNPGFGGQKFIPSALKKVRSLNKIKQEINPKLTIALDGGVTLHNVEEIVRAGVELVVAGSSVFHAEDVDKRVKEFLVKL